MKKIMVVIVLVLSLFLVSGCEKRLSNSYIEIDSKQDDYELFIIPNSVDIFDLDDVDMEFYWINTNDIDSYTVKLYEANLVITVVDVGMTIIMYNQNGFYYVLVGKDMYGNNNWCPNSTKKIYLRPD